MNRTSIHSLERRPMFTREWRLSQRLALWLARRQVSPNAISLVGMIGGIAAGCALAATSHIGSSRAAFLFAIGCIILRGLANLMDGMVAVESQRCSPVGELFNEVPDRISDIAILIGAGCAQGGEPILGLAAACVAVFVAYVRAQGKAAGAHQEYCGPMGKPGRMLTVTAVSLYCALAPRSWQPVFALDLGLMSGGLMWIIIGGIWTSVRRLHRIFRTLAQKPNASRP